MKRLVSVLFGLFGLLYGTTTWAEIMCCPENQQCGDVCCPKKGCNTEGTGCAENGCNAKAGYGLWNSECTYCPDIAEGYYVDASGQCAFISDCTNSGGCLKYAYNGGYECYTSAVYDGYYADYNGQCVPTSNCTSMGGCLYNYNNNGGYVCDTSAFYNGYYADYNGQCVNCSDKGSGYGTYDGYCVYCSDYGYVSDGYGYCVDPLYTCPSGFVPSGYSGDVCCGNGQDFSKYASISYDGYDHGWWPDAYGWTPPTNSFTACGCPYSECGFYYYGDGYCTNGGYSFTHESEPGLISIGPNTGCPSFSGYNPVYSGPGYEQNICCYMDVDGRPFEAASLAYWLVSAQSCSDFDLFVHPSSRCCPEGYYYDNGICCPDGYYNDDGICKYYW